MLPGQSSQRRQFEQSSAQKTSRVQKCKGELVLREAAKRPMEEQFCIPALREEESNKQGT
jgi:hypothetical protein